MKVKQFKNGNGNTVTIHTSAKSHGYFFRVKNPEGALIYTSDFFGTIGGAQGAAWLR